MVEFTTMLIIKREMIERGGREEMGERGRRFVCVIKGERFFWLNCMFDSLCLF